MDGLIHWPNDQGYALIAFIVKDGDTWDSLYAPTMSDIEKKCEEYGILVEPLKEQMREHPESHTFFVDMGRYRADNTEEFTS